MAPELTWRSVAGDVNVKTAAIGTFEHWVEDMVIELFKRYNPTSPLTQPIMPNVPIDWGDVTVIVTQAGIYGVGVAAKRADVKAVGFTGLLNQLFYRLYAFIEPMIVGA